MGGTLLVGSGFDSVFFCSSSDWGFFFFPLSVYGWILSLSFSGLDWRCSIGFFFSFVRKLWCALCGWVVVVVVVVVVCSTN